MLRKRRWYGRFVQWLESTSYVQASDLSLPAPEKFPIGLSCCPLAASLAVYVYLIRLLQRSRVEQAVLENLRCSSVLALALEISTFLPQLYKDIIGICKRRADSRTTVVDG